MTTWALDPERYSVTPQRNILSSDAGSGVVHRRQTNTAVSAATGEAEVQRWQLDWEYASETDRQTVRGYLTDTAGGALPLDFTPPQAGSSIKARIVDFQVNAAHPVGGVRMVVVLEEVL